MSHWKQMVCEDNPNLHHFDIFGHSPITLEITGHSMAKVKSQDGERNMLFLSFKGADKKLGLNVTNGQIIEAVTGDADPDNWIGKTITLRCAVCRGEDCIRVDSPPGMRFTKATPKYDYTDKKTKQEVK